MESPVSTLPHLPSRSYLSLINHLCSSLDREPQISLATPVLLQELALTTAKEPLQNSMMLEDVFDGIDLQDESVTSQQHHDFFKDFELLINETGDFVPQNCVNLFEELDVNDYDVDCITKQTLDLATAIQLDSVECDKKAEEAPKLVESNAVISFGVLETNDESLVDNVPEKAKTATEFQMDLVECDKSLSEIIESKTEEVPKLVVNSGVLETNNEMLSREIGLEKTVVPSSVSQMVEDDDVEEGEISGDDNDNNNNMFIEDDDPPVEINEESHISQEVYNKEKVESIGIKSKTARSKESKARKKAKSRKKRAQERIALGVKKLKLKTVAPKPKPIKYCRHYLKGRCHEGAKCKFSHDIIPETKSSPCCYFATQSCMKGDDCPYDHDLSKYPCNNFVTKGFCHRGDHCLFSHKVKCASDTPSKDVTPSSNKQTVREAIAKLPGIQERLPTSVGFLKPSTQSNEHLTPQQIAPLRKPSVAPKGMSFLSSGETSNEKTLNSDKQSEHLPLETPPKGVSFLSVPSEEYKALNQEPQEPSSSRSLKTTPPTFSRVQSSLNSAMKLAAEFESAKVERRSNDPVEAVSKGDVLVNMNIARNSGNISSKILEFLSTFSHDKN